MELPEEVILQQDTNEGEDKAPGHEPEWVEKCNASLVRITREDEPFVDIAEFTLKLFIFHVVRVDEIECGDKYWHAKE